MEKRDIPQCLHVIDFEAVFRLVKQGKAYQLLLYQTLSGMKNDLTGARLKPNLLDDTQKKRQRRVSFADEMDYGESSFQRVLIIVTTTTSKAVVTTEKIAFWKG